MRPRLPANHVRLHISSKSGQVNVTIPTETARSLKSIIDQVYRVELTKEGILLRPVEVETETPPPIPPPWLDT